MRNNTKNEQRERKNEGMNIRYVERERTHEISTLSLPLARDKFSKAKSPSFFNVTFEILQNRFVIKEPLLV
jgi:hypothetical protein